MKAFVSLLSVAALSACMSSGSDGNGGAAFLAGEAAFATRTCVQSNFAAAPVKAAFLARGYKVMSITSTKDLDLAQPGVGALAAKRFTANGQTPCAWYPGGANGQIVIDAAAAELTRLGYSETAERGIWSNGSRRVRLVGQTVSNLGAGIYSSSVGVSAVQ